ncbi:hypothetical protein DFJ58DRAFT_734345 [Suillus subalutaceus]|uniref:uncharacterized protein n=1 Tax=Suillus subalutaceus TaxID=48586 RepID=UPI001B85E430|nr:uncharacterized protein DFJ58DRAFT_734345 [Suillus subalutaceus]KAG1837453.1 hypothetical protein DFJ58DRAFT_734345 [Suillus subalutaceus]
MCAIYDTLGQWSIKLTHNLFEAETFNNENRYKPSATPIDDESDNNNLGPEFDISTWAVAERCKTYPADIISTHNVQPLPAYGENHIFIPPLQYESKLKGAPVEVHMAFCHHRIIKSKRDVFKAILRELIVPSPPSTMPSSPFKFKGPGSSS